MVSLTFFFDPLLYAGVASIIIAMILVNRLKNQVPKKKDQDFTVHPSDGFSIAYGSALKRDYGPILRHMLSGLKSKGDRRLVKRVESLEGKRPGVIKPSVLSSIIFQYRRIVEAA
jgi:hypothetical protein